MIQKARWAGWGLLGAGLLFGLVLGASWASRKQPSPRWFSAAPGSVEEGFARIRIGMSRDGAVSVLRACDPYDIDTMYSEGMTRQGRSWTVTKLDGELFEDLPPAEEIARCVLSVLDNDGRALEVVLGPGGVVSGKRFSPGFWEYRLQKASRVLAQSARDLVSGSWWAEQLRKSCRSLHRRRQYAGPCLAAAFLLVCVCVLRRGNAR